MRVLIYVIIFQNAFMANANNETAYRSAEIYERCMRHLSQWDQDMVISLADSLMHVALVEKDSFHLQKAYMLLSEMAYHRGDFEKCLKYAKKNLPILSGQGDFESYALVLARFGNIHRHYGNIDSSLYYVELAKSYIPKLEDPDKLKINVYNDLGIIFIELGKVDSAIYYQLALLDLIPETDSNYLHAVNYNLARSFETLQNNQKEKQYLDKSLSYCAGKKFVGSRAKIMAKIAAYWSEKKQYEKAFPLIKESIQLQEGNGKEDKIIQSYAIYSSILVGLKRYDEATLALDKIAYSADDINLEKSYQYHLNRLGIALARGNDADFNKYLPAAKKVIGKLNQSRANKSFHKLLFDYHQKHQNFQQANNHLLAYTSITDSLNNLEQQQFSRNLESQFEFEKNNLRISRLEENEFVAQKDLARQRKFLLLGGIALGLFSLFSFFLYNLYKKVNTQKNFIQKALSEKETLLREIHHRVKNNLQLVSSLLTLQSRSIKDTTAIAAINDGKARVRSMALIHQDLYNKDNLTGISVKSYIEKLSSEIFQTYNIAPDKIQLQTRIQEMELDVDTVIPLGLIVNELITNTLKYAFPNNEKGLLEIELKESGKQLTLTVKDNGIGIDLVALKSSKSFGNRLVTILTEQLEGQLNINTNNGTSVEIIISDYKKAA